VANWRRLALLLWPEHRVRIERDWFSIYAAFFDLLPRVRQAHDDDDDDELRRIYSFGEWCIRSGDHDLMNAAGTAFYELIFKSRRHGAMAVPWLSDLVVETVGVLWCDELLGNDGFTAAEVGAMPDSGRSWRAVTASGE
jgi:hypothetical protein